MDNLKKKIERLDDKISQYVVNEENSKTIYAIGKSKLYRINENEIDIRKRDLISKVKFIKESLTVLLKSHFQLEKNGLQKT